MAHVKERHVGGTTATAATEEPTGAAAACSHRGCVGSPTEDVRTVANAVTLARGAGCLAAVTASIATGNVALLFLGLAVHCVGDVADGIVARHRNEETRAGAVLDIVSDRMCVALYYLSYGHLHHDLLLPIALFLFQFMVLDAQLSLSFLNWPLRSLNYFGTVDRAIYRWNWSPAGKAANSGALVVLMLVTHSAPLCTGLVLVMWAIKVGSLRALYRRGVPSPVGCCTGDAA
jgi:CDP-diacylglycerol--glycerol-3-phosphate 3-phosphatidyltransferase